MATVSSVVSDVTMFRYFLKSHCVFVQKGHDNFFTRSAGILLAYFSRVPGWSEGSPLGKISFILMQFCQIVG